MIEFINNHFTVASGITVVLVFFARLMSKSEGPTLWAFLPTWFDVTTWETRWGWKGKIGQGVVTAVISGGMVLIAAQEGGWTFDEWKSAGHAALGAMGLWHYIKKAVPSKPKKLDEVVSEPAMSDPKNVGSVLLVLFVSSCAVAGSFEESKLAGLDPQARVSAAPPSERCMSLDSQRRTWGAIGKGAGVLSGAQGLVMIPVDDKNARIGLAAGTVAASTLAIVGIWVSEDVGNTWVKECSNK